jgi:hypothetical protein
MLRLPNVLLGRDILPTGILMGLIWVIVNTIIFIVFSFLSLIPVAIVLGMIWTIEKRITKLMSPAIRRFLHLEDYKNILDKDFVKVK